MWALRENLNNENTYRQDYSWLHCNHLNDFLRYLPHNLPRVNFIFILWKFYFLKIQKYSNNQCFFFSEFCNAILNFLHYYDVPMVLLCLLSHQFEKKFRSRSLSCTFSANRETTKTKDPSTPNRIKTLMACLWIILWGRIPDHWW